MNKQQLNSRLRRLMYKEINDMCARYEDGGFRLKPKYTNTITRGNQGYWMEDGTDFEVIGNVWDNPELLKAGDSE